MLCGSPSSVTTKSLAVSPSMGRPSLSVTVTVWTMSFTPARNVGCGCCAATTAPNERPQTIAARVKNRTSEPETQTRLHLAHGIREGRQSELRAADDGVDRRVGDAVQHVRRADAPVEIEPFAPCECAADAAVERKLSRAGDGVAPGGAPMT